MVLNLLFSKGFHQGPDNHCPGADRAVNGVTMGSSIIPHIGLSVYVEDSGTLLNI